LLLALSDEKHVFAEDGGARRFCCLILGHAIDEIGKVRAEYVQNNETKNYAPPVVREELGGFIGGKGGHREVQEI